MSTLRRRRAVISDDRALQIINNVAEEYVDLGQTDFATKAELCSAILWLRKHDLEEWQRMHSTLSDISLLCARRLLRTDLPRKRGTKCQRAKA